MDITALRQFSNIQTNFMFYVYLSGISGVFDQATNFTITTRETAILGKTRAKTDYRFLNRQMSLPQGTSHEGEWNVTVSLPNEGGVLQDWVKWYYYAESMKLNGVSYKTNAVVQLLNLDGTKTNTVYGLIGIYPIVIPGIEGLNQENTEGHVTFECKFGVDDIAHGTVNGTAITWVESDPNINFPYKDKLANLALLS